MQHFAVTKAVLKIRTKKRSILFLTAITITSKEKADFSAFADGCNSHFAKSRRAKLSIIYHQSWGKYNDRRTKSY